MKKIGLLNPFMAQLHDFDLWIRLCMKSNIYIYQEELFKFRIRSGNQNASGNKPENNARMLWEYENILYNYLSIKNIKDIESIFPEISDMFPKRLIKNEFKDFIIGMLALTKGEYEVHRNFGLKVIFSFFKENISSYDLINKSIGFKYSDIISKSHLSYYNSSVIQDSFKVKG